MKVIGDDIIILKKGEMSKARKRAQKWSTEEGDQFSVFFISPRYKKLFVESYIDGWLARYGPTHNVTLDLAHEGRLISVLEYMAMHGSKWISSQAWRLLTR